MCVSGFTGSGLKDRWGQRSEVGRFTSVKKNPRKVSESVKSLVWPRSRILFFLEHWLWMTGLLSEDEAFENRRIFLWFIDSGLNTNVNTVQPSDQDLRWSRCRFRLFGSLKKKDRLVCCLAVGEFLDEVRLSPVAHPGASFFSLWRRFWPSVLMYLDVAGQHSGAKEPEVQKAAGLQKKRENWTRRTKWVKAALMVLLLLWPSLMSIGAGVVLFFLYSSSDGSADELSAAEFIWVFIATCLKWKK